jgi:hypothetical protein
MNNGKYIVRIWSLTGSMGYKFGDTAQTYYEKNKDKIMEKIK